MRLATLILILAILSPVPAPAQDQTYFDVRFRGITVAEIAVAARETPETYAVAARLRSTGMAAMFSRVRFDLTVEGAVTPPDLRPTRHTEDVDTSRRQSIVELRWRGSLPDIVRQSPAPTPDAADPTTAAGTIDPLTALWRLARPRGQDRLCGFDLQVYDGVRRSALRLGPPRPEAGVIICDGVYQRLRGFTAAEMDERQMFPFTTFFAPSGDLWRLTEVRATSLLGPVRITRRD